jgi:prevent-host-death family protein
MQAQWTLQDAKNKFSEVVNAACSGSPQIVSKRGEDAVVILSVESYRQLLKQGPLGGATSFKELLLAVPQKEDKEPNGQEGEQLELREVDF